jgi:hypothetical protein
LKEYLFLIVYLVSLATNFVLLWPLEFEFGHPDLHFGRQKQNLVAQATILVDNIEL